MSAPKNHHYVPQSILKQFQSPEGQLYYFYKGSPEKPVIHRNTESIFKKRHLYSFTEKDGTKNSEVEATFFKDLDTNVDPIAKKIIANVRKETLPNLTSEEKLLWNSFYIKQHSRVPERFFGGASDDILETTYEDTKGRIYDRCSPELQQMLDDPEFKKRLQEESKVKSLASDLPESNDLLERRGIFFVKILDPKRSFIIGSNPLVRFNNSGSDHLADKATELWYPIAHDIAVSIGSYDERETLFTLNDCVPHTNLIRKLNYYIFAQSNEIAGRSKTLIESITRDFVRKSKK